jgi:ketosteroid isomerase-like protein
VSAGATRQNVELVRRFYELAQTYRHGRWDHLELLATTIVFRPIAEWPDAGERRGREQFREFMESFWSGEEWQELAYVATSQFGIGDKVITRIELAGRGRGSAADTRGRVYNVATIDSGRIVCLEDFTHRDDALAAAWRTTRVSPDVDTIRKSLDLISLEGARAPSLLAWTWHPEIRMTSAMGQGSESQTYIGHEGMRRYYDDLFASFAELSFEHPEYSEVDDQVLALDTLRGRRSESGAALLQPGAAIWRFASGKIVEGRSFLSHEEGLHAAGLGSSRGDYPSHP